MNCQSIIGEQQHYLCAVDSALQARREIAVREVASKDMGRSADCIVPLVRAQSLKDVTAPSVLAAQVSEGMMRRSTSR